jgi:hypothetical protein
MSLVRLATHAFLALTTLITVIVVHVGLLPGLFGSFFAAIIFAAASLTARYEELFKLEAITKVIAMNCAIVFVIVLPFTLHSLTDEWDGFVAEVFLGLTIMTAVSGATLCVVFSCGLKTYIADLFQKMGWANRV